jgi:GntR family transcriptional regulator
MTPISLQPGPVTLYAQLASIMRDRIRSALWKPDEEIPTLDQLVEEFSVARVTVRQAVQMLVNEGLLSSHRGRRTYVTYEPHDRDVNPLFSYTGSIDKETADYSINVLARQEYDALPQALHSEIGCDTAGRYMRIRKIDCENGVPYVYSDHYVLLSLYKRFPAKAVFQVKLSRLVRDHATPPLASGKERISVGAVNYEEAGYLEVPIGSPAARIKRVFVTSDGKIACLGNLIYRADRFAVDRDITQLLVRPTFASPQSGATRRAPARRRINRPA